MIRQIRHPLVDRDVIGIVDHILSITDGNLVAARRRLDEIDDLLASIAETPRSGMRLSGDLEGWLVRHGGSGRRLTVVFRPNLDRDILFIALVAFGGRDWMRLAAGRRETPQSQRRATKIGTLPVVAKDRTLDAIPSGGLQEAWQGSGLRY